MNRPLLVIFIGVCLITSSVLCQDNNDPQTEDLTDDRTTLTWRPTDNPTIIVQAADGYQIQVETTQFDVHGENDDYVLVKSVTEYDGEDDNALMFTYTVSGKPRYLYNNNKIQADYVGTNNSNSFVIQFTRVGEAATTTTEPPSTTTTPAMPTPSPQESNTLTVYLYGLAAVEFGTSANQDKLRKAIASMGGDYCQAQGCPLNGSITLNNVKIALLLQCPIIWENYMNCFNLTFSLPIVKRDDYNENEPWAGYQLKTSHLKAMWDTYAEKYMKGLGLDLYNVPNISKITTYRLIVICVVIVLLIVLILILRHIAARINKKRRKLSSTVSIMSKPSNRSSQLSLTPHYLQVLPPLFSNDFPMYTDQVSHTTYTDYKSTFAEDIDNDPPIPKSVLDISGNDADELIDADA